MERKQGRVFGSKAGLRKTGAHRIRSSIGRLGLYSAMQTLQMKVQKVGRSIDTAEASRSGRGPCEGRQSVWYDGRVICFPSFSCLTI